MGAEDPTPPAPGRLPEEGVELEDVGPLQERETDSKTFSISGAHLTNGRLQKLYLGFLISSMKETNKPHCQREKKKKVM